MFYPHAAKGPAAADTALAAAPREDDEKAAVAETEGTEAIDTSQEVKLVMYLLGSGRRILTRYLTGLMRN